MSKNVHGCPMFFRPVKSGKALICRIVLNDEEQKYVDELLTAATELDNLLNIAHRKGISHDDVRMKISSLMDEAGL